MKKTYQQPRTEETRVELQQMMVGSPAKPETLGEQGGNNLGDDVDLSRRRNSVWDFDDEE